MPMMQEQRQQKNLGGGAIVHQNAAVHQAVNDPSIYGVLSTACKAEVDTINAKGLAQWSDADYSYMVSMLLVARHC
jgi:hypothetical protein